MEKVHPEKGGHRLQDGGQNDDPFGWDGADAPPPEKENPKDGRQDEPKTFVTVSEGTTKRLPRAPSATRGGRILQ